MRTESFSMLPNFNLSKCTFAACISGIDGDEMVVLSGNSVFRWDFDEKKLSYGKNKKMILEGSHCSPICLNGEMRLVTRRSEDFKLQRFFITN